MASFREILTGAAQRFRSLRVVLSKHRLAPVSPWQAYAWVLYMAVVVRVAWMSDDAFIGMRPILSLLQGHGLVSNAGERVQAFTSPLWLLLNIPLHAILREVYFSTLLMSLVVSGIAGWLLIRSTKRPIDTCVVGLVLSFSRAATDFSTSGLENPLVHLMLMIVLLIYRSEKTNLATTFWLFFCSGLLVLTRMDCVLLVAPLLVYHLWTVRSKTHVLRACVALTPVAAWMLFSLVYYGFPFPNTAYAKMNLGISQNLLFAQGWNYLMDGVQRDPLTMLVIVGSIVGALFGKRSRAALVMLGPLFYMVYILKIGGDFMSGRFFTAMLFVSLFSMGSWLLVSVRTPHLFGIAALVGIVILSVPHNQLHSPPEKCFVPSTGIVDERGCYEGHTALFRNIRKTGNEWVYQTHPYWQRGIEMAKSGDAVTVDLLHGLAGCAAGPTVHIVDEAALTDAFLARLSTLRTRTGWRIGHFYRILPAGYIDTLKTGKPHLENPCLQQYYDKLSIVIRDPIFSWTRFKTIAAINVGAYDHWLDPACH